MKRTIAVATILIALMIFPTKLLGEESKSPGAAFADSLAAGIGGFTIHGSEANVSIHHLAAILDITQSIDTFLVALKLLEDGDAEAKAVIPVILKNAERLKIFGSNLDRAEDSSERKRAANVADSIAAINIKQTKEEPVCDVAPKDKNKKITILILSYTPCGGKKETDGAGDDLARLLRRKMLAAFEKNGSKATIIPIIQVQKFRRQHDVWDYSDDEMAKHFHADYVISFSIEALSLYQKGSRKKVFMGRTTIALTVRNSNQPEDDPIYEEDYDEFEPFSERQEVGTCSRQKYRRQFLDRVADQLSSRFVR